MKQKIIYGLLALLFLAACQTTGAGAAEITDAVDVPRITPQELKAQVDAGERVVVADARSYESFQERHIAGAISVPLTEVDEHLKELPKRAHIVLYCT